MPVSTSTSSRPRRGTQVAVHVGDPERERERDADDAVCRTIAGDPAIQRRRCAASWRCSRSRTSPAASAASSRSTTSRSTSRRARSLGLIGPNGAGKTTAFNVITRLYTPDGGAVVFDGDEPARDAAYRIVRRGHRAHVPEPRALPHMTVLENVLVGAHRRRLVPRERRRAGARGARLPRPRRRSRRAPPPGLPFGTLKRIELARALVGEAAPAAARRAGRRPEPRGGRRARRR